MQSLCIIMQVSRLLDNIKLARATIRIECKFLLTVQGSRCATIAMFFLGACAALDRVYDNVAIETFLLFITLARTVYCAVHFASNYISHRLFYSSSLCS